MTGSRSLRRTSAWALLAATLTAAAATHQHAGLADPPVERASETVLSTHNPLSNAGHWHAVLQIVQENACWACHWHRFAGLPYLAPSSLPALAGCAAAVLPPRSAVSVARFTRLSRGPPSVL